jgi:hypothetical protein
VTEQFFLYVNWSHELLRNQERVGGHFNFIRQPLHRGVISTEIFNAGLRVAWSKMCKAANVPILLHDFRRSAIRNMIRAGVPEKTAMRISGHVRRSVFDRYDIGSDADLAEAAERIENRRIGSN